MRSWLMIGQFYRFYRVCDKTFAVTAHAMPVSYSVSASVASVEGDANFCPDLTQYA